MSVDIYRTTLGNKIQMIVARGRVQLRIRGRTFLVSKYGNDAVALEHAANDCLTYLLDLAGDMGGAGEALFGKLRQKKIEWAHELGGRVQKEKERQELVDCAKRNYTLTYAMHDTKVVPMYCFAAGHGDLGLTVFDETPAAAHRQYIERVGAGLKNKIGDKFDVIVEYRGGTELFHTDLGEYQS